MADKKIVAGVLLDEATTISFIDVCEICHISEEMLIEMIEHGLINPQPTQIEPHYIDAKNIQRIRSARRLQHDLDINLSGAALVLELIDELEQLRNELHILQHHVSGG